MRDLETIAAAITLAETGHLRFRDPSTRARPRRRLTASWMCSPPHQQEQIRIQLSTSIEAVVAQQLLPRIGGGRVAAIEIMVATSALRNLIREGKSYQIYSVIETGHQYGMQAMDRVLADLHRNGTVTFDEAASRAIDRENFSATCQGILMLQNMLKLISETMQNAAKKEGRIMVLMEKNTEIYSVQPAATLPARRTVRQPRWPPQPTLRGRMSRHGMRPLRTPLM